MPSGKGERKRKEPKAEERYRDIWVKRSSTRKHFLRRRKKDENEANVFLLDDLVNYPIACGSSGTPGAGDSVGFALVAYPARYGISGVVTFVVNQNGTVYEKDLGKNIEATAKAMTRHNPDKTWREVARR
jgi:hypothetical protein